MNAPEDKVLELARQQARIDLAAACRLVALFGWTDLLATHLSIRVPGRRDRYLVNPLGLLFEEVCVSAILEVDLEGRIVAGEGELNPAAVVIHGAIHAEAEQAEAVVHLHSREGVAISCQASGLLPLTQMSLMVLGDLAYHDFQGVVLDTDERASLLADLGDKNLLILRNHGTLAIGRTMAEAFARIWRLERACRFQLAAQSAGAPLITPASAVIERTLEQARAVYGPQSSFLPSGRREWTALLRRLDRELPGYRN
ncbi:class II aldolase [Rhodocyclus tenuis]|uniref:Class II aldolase n=2 Tax=Rhodocyclus TaxID=1064 RepID=A0A6L5JZV9_RHOTE|nr:class II aldolase/adducin family protein [Rhodocyclus gracilis]MQY52382.1 class II aldolase [Rhodocyclus gracilis]NJA88289.1 class II aldolase [Rhodocyclus gracilis]